jgi:hypothetical protein
MASVGGQAYIPLIQKDCLPTTNIPLFLPNLSNIARLDFPSKNLVMSC